MKKVLVTGGTGFVGRRLVEKLLERGDRVTVLTRDASRARRQFPGRVRCASWTPDHEGPWVEELGVIDAVVHLAGESVVKRWSQAVKDRIVKSRVDSTRLLVEAIGKAKQKPSVFVCASAVGFYGPHPADEQLDEASEPGQGFLADVVKRWEEAARAVEVHGVRAAMVRIGVVLGEGGGPLEKMVLPFKLFGGGPIGDGKQIISWVHREDVVGMLLLALDDDRVKGPINAVSPNPVDADEMARALGLVLNRPSWIRAPAAVVGLVMGEAAEIVTQGQRVFPRRAVELGYEFQRPRLVPALESILGDREQPGAAWNPEKLDKSLVRIRAPIILLASVILLGSAALWSVGRGRWSFADAVYLVINAVSTVGFTELEGMAQVRFAHLVTIVIILAGLGTVAYFQSSLTALLVQGVIGERFRMRRMQNRIEVLRDHVIVTGAGSTGVHAIEELYATRAVFVVVDRSVEVLERISREIAGGELLFVVGDATDDMVLMQAGITRAKGVIAALTEDKDNLYVTLSARSLNARARIVSKVIAHDAAPKMIRAGANATVSPNMIGGRRLASELVRPTVTEFIDQMLRDKEDVLRLEEVSIPDGSSFIGRSLRDVPIRAETKLLVVALRVDKKFIYNPEPSTVIEANSVLVVLGASANVARLREMIKPGPPGAR